MKYIMKVEKSNLRARLENMLMNQLKMGEHQAKCGALPTSMNSTRFKHHKIRFLQNCTRALLKDIFQSVNLPNMFLICIYEEYFPIRSMKIRTRKKGNSNSAWYFGGVYTYNLTTVVW